METQSLDNRDRDKLLEQIKSKCKSRAKSSAFGILIVLIVTIVFLFYLGQRLDDTIAISSFILWIVIGCLAGWTVLHNYRFKKEIDNLDTPNQLLSRFKEYARIETITACIAWLLLIVDYFLNASDHYFSAIGVLLGFVVCIIFYIKGYGRWYRRDKEIKEQLQELIDK